MGLARESSSKIKAIIGRRVAELRRSRGWTQEKLAEKVDATVQWVSRIEGGGENVTVETLVLFANVLGVGVVELFTPTTTDAPAATMRGRPRKS